MKTFKIYKILLSCPKYLKIYINSKDYMSKIAKVYLKHQQYLKYLLILNSNIQTKPAYILILCILTYVIQIYM